MSYVDIWSGVGGRRANKEERGLWKLERTLPSWKENSSPQLSSQLSKRGPQVALPLPHVKAFSGEAPSRMDALAVNKPEAGLDSGCQGSWGTAAVKMRDFACSVLCHRPPFSSSRRSGSFWAGCMDSGPSGLYKLLLPLQTFIPAGLRLPGLLFILVLCSHQRGLFWKGAYGPVRVTWADLSSGLLFLAKPNRH